jgi:ankyrin repeat protein
LNFVKSLIETGYDDWPKPDELGQTPLHFAAEYGHLDIIDYLLDYNNDIFEQNIL